MVRITEFDLATALSTEHSAMKDLVDSWKERDNGGGFNPYAQVPRNVLSGHLNPSERDRILTRVSGYKPRMLPARNIELTKLTWELFDSMGGDVTGIPSYTVAWPGLEVRISGGYVYRLPGREYLVINWFKKKSPSERLVRSVLDILELTRPIGWPAYRVPGLLVVDEQDLRIAGPVAPLKTREFRSKVDLIKNLAA